MTSGGNMRVLHLKRGKLTGTNQMYIFCCSTHSEETDQNQKLNQNNFNLFSLDLDSAKQQFLFSIFHHRSLTKAKYSVGQWLVKHCTDRAFCNWTALFKALLRCSAWHQSPEGDDWRGVHTHRSSSTSHPGAQQSHQSWGAPEPLKNYSFRQWAQGQGLPMAGFTFFSSAKLCQPKTPVFRLLWGELAFRHRQITPWSRITVEKITVHLYPADLANNNDLFDNTCELRHVL